MMTMKKLLPPVFLAAILGCVFVASPIGAFPASSSKSGAAAAVEFTVEELAFGDWMKIIEDKIDGVISSAKGIGAIVTDKLEQIGQEALEKLVSATGKLEGALEDAVAKFVQEILPKLIAKASSVASKGAAGLESVANAVVAVIKKLGVKALKAGVDWVEANKKLVGKLQAGLLIQKFKEAILDLGGGRVFEVADYSLTSRAVDYVKEKVKDLAKLAYAEAVIMVDNIIYYLKTYGIPALRAVLAWVKEMQCDLGEMLYQMLHKKLLAALGGDEVEAAFAAIETLGFGDWLEVIGDKIMDVIQSGKAIGKEAADAIRDLGHEALVKIIEASASIQTATETFLAEVLPKILEKTKAIAEKSEEAAGQVIDSIVGILKKLGVKGLRMAIKWLEENKDDIGEKIYDAIIAKVKEALAEVLPNAVFDEVHSYDAVQTLSFKDWLEAVGGKIADIIEAAKEIGKEAGEAIKDLGQEALDKLIQATADIQAARQRFIDEVLPKILEKTKEIAAKGEESAAKVIDAIVGILKKLGAKGLLMAVEWLEKNKDDIGRNIYDMIIAKIEKALEEVGVAGAASCVQAFDDVETLALKDWLEAVGGKIVDIIKMGKDLGEEAIVDITTDVLDKLIQASASIDSAKRRFVEDILPKIMEKLKEIAARGEAAAAKAIDVIVDLLRGLGNQALIMALDWLNEHKEEIGQVIYDKIIAKIEKALAEIGIQTLSFADWLEAIGGKIVDAIEAAKEIGKEAGEAIKDLGQEALDKLIQASTDIQAAKQKFIEEVLPKILEITKGIAAKGEENAAKVIDAIVGILKNLGAKGLRMAIDWLEEHKDEIGRQIYDKIVAKIEKALAEVGVAGPALFEPDVQTLALKDWIDALKDSLKGMGESVKKTVTAILDSLTMPNWDDILRDEIADASSLADLTLLADWLDLWVYKNSMAIPRFIVLVLPTFLEKAREILAKGINNADVAIDSIERLLRSLGAQGLQTALDWLHKSRDELGEIIYENLREKIEKSLAKIGIETGTDIAAASYGMIETAEEHVKSALMKAAYAGYDAAVYLFDKMIAFLKLLGVGALKVAERLVEANKCLVGAYIYSMAMAKVKAAIKVAVIGGIVG